MSIFEVFIWFCKEQKIMDTLFYCFYKNKPTLYYPTMPFKRNVSLKTLVEYYLYKQFEYIFNTIFEQQYLNPHTSIFDAKRLNKISNRWKNFLDNNIFISDKFLKKWDDVYLSNSFYEINGTVISLGEGKLNDRITIQLEDGNRRDYLLWYFDKFIINGEERKPSFYIKRNRKFYGID